MIKTISNTAFTLAIIAVLNFVLVTLIFRELGKTGTTEMGLIILGVSFILMISNIVGGSAFVYLTSRVSNSTLLLVSYCWAIFSTFFMGSILYIFELVPMDYIWWVWGIGLLESFYSVNYQLFIGKGEMKNHNVLKIVQKSIQLILFVLLGISIQNFTYTLAISNIVTVIFSMIIVVKGLPTFDISEPKSIFKRAFKYGIQVQTSNIIQLLNYRVLYFIIEKTMGNALGLFIVAIQLTESLWIPSKALSIIQYGKVAKERDNSKNSLLSLSFLKISVIVTFLLLITLLLLPNFFFLWVFDKDIEGVKPIIFSLSIGVMAMSFTQTFSHYFSGRGHYHYLIKGALIGLVVLLLSGYFLIINFGILGAGLATSFSYFASSIYLGKGFLAQTKLKLKDFLFKKNELLQVIQIFKK